MSQKCFLLDYYYKCVCVCVFALLLRLRGFVSNEFMWLFESNDKIDSVVVQASSEYLYLILIYESFSVKKLVESDIQVLCISEFPHHQWYYTLLIVHIEYGILGKGFQISTNQKRENSAFSPLIG